MVRISKNKLAMELPIQIVVTMIIGLVIFGLGFGLFGQIAGESEDTVDDLRKQVQTGIQDLECSGSNEWICVPSVKLRQGERTTVSASVINRGEDSETFSIKVKKNNAELANYPQGEIQSSNCGTLLVTEIRDGIDISRGEGARIPIYISATKVTAQTCSFTAVVELNNGESTPLIVRIE